MENKKKNLGIYRGIGDRETEFKSLAMALTVIAIALFMGALALGNAFASLESHRATFTSAALGTLQPSHYMLVYLLFLLLVEQPDAILAARRAALVANDWLCRLKSSRRRIIASTCQGHWGVRGKRFVKRPLNQTRIDTHVTN